MFVKYYLCFFGNFFSKTLLLKYLSKSLVASMPLFLCEYRLVTILVRVISNNKNIFIMMIIICDNLKDWF